jgi:signal transduction histidine kinase
VSDREIDALARLGRAFDEQLRTLIKTEQRLFFSQRDLARQVARLAAVNRFALDVADLRDPVAILERAADLFLEAYPFEQALGCLSDADGLLSPVAIRTVPGRDPRRAEARCGLSMSWGAPLGPMILQGDRVQEGDLDSLLRCFGQLFGDDQPVTGSGMLVVPLVRRGSAPVGAIAVRRVSRALGFHEELPSARDLPFLELVAQVIAAAVTNATLVRDLQASYGALEAAQRSLVDRERLAALGEFAAVVAHEVRNPLGSIFNATSLLRRLVAAEPESLAVLEILHEEAARLNQIVTDLIDFARPHPPALRPEDLRKLVEAALEGVRNATPGARLEIIGDEGPVHAWIDARMIRQAIVNLVVNAVQASPEGAPVTVRLASDGERFVEVEVRDRGPGITPNLRDRIFEPFFTTKATGTGLGLSVVKRVVEAHGGTISVADGDRAVGTTFTIRVPVRS